MKTTLNSANVAQAFRQPVIGIVKHAQYVTEGRYVGFKEQWEVTNYVGEKGYKFCLEGY